MQKLYNTVGAFLIVILKGSTPHIEERNFIETPVQGFRPKTYQFDFGNRDANGKRHLKTCGMVQISASYHLPVGSYECGKKFGRNALL